MCPNCGNDDQPNNEATNKLFKEVMEVIDKPKLITAARPRRIVTLRLQGVGEHLPGEKEFSVEWLPGWQTRKLITPPDWPEPVVARAREMADDFERRLKMEATT